MLMLSFLAIVVACAVLATELGRFGSYPQWKAGAGGS